MVKDFPTIKKWSVRLMDFLKSSHGSQYKPNFEGIEYRWEKCIELNGGYIENKGKFPLIFFCFLCYISRVLLELPS